LDTEVSARVTRLPYMRWLRTFVGSAPLIMTCTAACIRDDAGRVLLMRRGGEASELWGFPGGAMELGESIAQAAAREAREEVGLEVLPEWLIGVYSDPQFGFSYANGDQVQVVILFFECRVVGGQLAPDQDEALEARYFGPDDAPPPLRPCCQAKLRDAFAWSGAVFVR
jgi:ADP-ribose pyrophosphatase YjhB (NUDIX family)